MLSTSVPADDVESADGLGVEKHPVDINVGCWLCVFRGVSNSTATKLSTLGVLDVRPEEGTSDHTYSFTGRSTDLR